MAANSRAARNARWEAPDLRSIHPGETIAIDEAYVSERLAGLAKDTDLSKYIL